MMTAAERLRSKSVTPEEEYTRSQSAAVPFVRVRSKTVVRWSVMSCGAIPVKEKDAGDQNKNRKDNEPVRSRRRDRCHDRAGSETGWRIDDELVGFRQSLGD